MACGCSGTHRPVLITSALAVADWLILPGRGFTPAHGYASVTSGTDIRGAAGAVLHPTLIALPASASPPRYPTPRQPSAWCSACCTCSRSPQPSSPTRRSPAPAADRPPVRRPGRQGHDRGEQPAAHPVAGPRRHRPLHRRHPPPRRTCLKIPRCMTPYTNLTCDSPSRQGTTETRAPQNKLFGLPT
jgi:hypothetical protein